MVVITTSERERVLHKQLKHQERQEIDPRTLAVIKKDLQFRREMQSVASFAAPPPPPPPPPPSQQSVLHSSSLSSRPTATTEEAAVVSSSASHNGSSGETTNAATASASNITENSSTSRRSHSASSKKHSSSRSREVSVETLAMSTWTSPIRPFSSSIDQERGSAAATAVTPPSPENTSSYDTTATGGSSNQSSSSDSRQAASPSSETTSSTDEQPQQQMEEEEEIELQYNHHLDDNIREISSVVSGAGTIRSSRSYASATSWHSGGGGSSLSMSSNYHPNAQMRADLAAAAASASGIEQPSPPPSGQPFDHNNTTPRISNQKTLWSTSSLLSSASSSAATRSSASSSLLLSAVGSALHDIPEVTDYISPATSEAEDTVENIHEKIVSLEGDIQGNGGYDEDEEGSDLSKNGEKSAFSSEEEEELNLQELEHEIKNKTGSEDSHGDETGHGIQSQSKQEDLQYDPREAGPSSPREAGPSSEIGGSDNDDDPMEDEEEESQPPPALSNDQPHSDEDLKRPVPMQISRSDEAILRVEDGEVTQYSSSEAVIRENGGAESAEKKAAEATRTSTSSSPPACRDPPARVPVLSQQDENPVPVRSLSPMRQRTPPRPPPQHLRARSVDFNTSSKLPGVPPRSITPIMRMRMAEQVELEPVTVEVTIQEEDEAEPSVHTSSASVTVYTYETGATQDDEMTEDDLKSFTSLKWKRKKKIAERKREQERKSLNGSRRRKSRKGRGRRRRQAESVSSWASSRGTRDTDDTSVYSANGVACQGIGILANLIQTRCGYENDSSSDESVASSKYSQSFATIEEEDPPSVKKDRVVSFDDESETDEQRRRRVLLQKQKPQKKEMRSLDSNLSQDVESETTTSQGVSLDDSEREKIYLESLVHQQESQVTEDGKEHAPRRTKAHMDELESQRIVNKIDPPESVIPSEESELQGSYDYNDGETRSSELGEESQSFNKNHKIDGQGEAAYGSSDTNTSVNDRESTMSSSHYISESENSGERLAPNRALEGESSVSYSRDNEYQSETTSIENDKEYEGDTTSTGEEVESPSQSTNQSIEERGPRQRRHGAEPTRNGGSHRNMRSVLPIPKHITDMLEEDMVSTKASTPEGPEQGIIHRIRGRHNLPPTREQVEFENVDMHDRNFIKKFVAVARTSGIPLLFHTKQQRHSYVTIQPIRVNAYIQFGIPQRSGKFSEPKLVWGTDDGSLSGVLGIFDIRSLDKVSVSDLEEYPIAVPGRSVILRTNRGKSYTFEAPNEQAAVRFIHGMRWVIARLSFNLIIGNLAGSCELLDIAKSDSIAPGRPEKAMNDVTCHLVDSNVTN